MVGNLVRCNPGNIATLLAGGLNRRCAVNEIAVLTFWEL